MWASHISMVMETTVNVSQTVVDVTLTASNKGDEGAFDIYPELRIADETSTLESIPFLGVDDSHVWNQQFSKEKLGMKDPGAYPLFLTLHYHDANKYPFSVPDIVLFRNGPKEHVLPFGGQITVTEIKKKGKVTVSLTNSIDKPIKGTLQAFLPKEVAVKEPVRTFNLIPGQTLKSLFEVTNSGALPGSKYKIFGVAEFTEQDIHYTVLLSEMIDIKESAGDKGAFKLAIGVGLLVLFLFLIFIGVELRKAGKKNET